MRIACPACNAAYQVPDEQLGVGRIVRCARCGTDWAPLDEIPASEAEPGRDSESPPPVIEPPLPPKLPESVVEQRRMAEAEIPIPIPPPPVVPTPMAAQRESLLLVLAWIVSLGLVGATVVGLYVGREAVMRKWPPSVRAYAALALTTRPAAPLEGHE